MRRRGATGSSPPPHGFIGERYDDGSGLQYLNARYYDPRLAMFVQPDWWEVTRPGVGTNRYSYSFNDPVNGRDPGGHEVIADDIDEKERERLEKDFEDARDNLERDIETAKAIEDTGKVKSKAERDYLERLEKVDMDGSVTIDEIAAHRNSMEKVLRDIGEPGEGVKVVREQLSSSGNPLERASAIPGDASKIRIYDSYFDLARDGGYKVTHEMAHASLGYSDRLPDAARPLVDGKHIFWDGKYRRVLGYRFRGIDAANQFGITEFTDRFTCSTGFAKC